MIGLKASHEFKSILEEHLSPSSPVRDPNHLIGREKALKAVERAFSARGRHAFIFGDRGVGKTSLAFSAAVLKNNASSEPLYVSCDAKTTFSSLMEDIYKVYVSKYVQGKPAKFFKFQPPFFEFGIEFTPENIDLSNLQSVNDASRLFEFICNDRNSEFVIIIDEFDQIVDEDTKSMIASLAKRVSDSEIDIRFIFCGIGRSVEALLGSHLSAGRYIVPVELDRLSSDALWQIVENACRAVDVAIDRETVIRIGVLSDGFPFFAHLVTENMLWSAFDDEESVIKLRKRHFKAGVEMAVKQSFVFLKSAYDKATMKYSDDYQEVLWAIADKPTLTRQTNDIYEKSYLPIMSRRNALLRDDEKRHVISIETFRNRLNNLKTDRHGKIIVGRGAGWYEYRENMIRGYVRIRAEEAGVPLSIDHY